MLLWQIRNVEKGIVDFSVLNVVDAAEESFRTMKANNEYPFVVPLCVPFIRTYLAEVFVKVTSVAEYDAPFVVL